MFNVFVYLWCTVSTLFFSFLLSVTDKIHVHFNTLFSTVEQENLAHTFFSTNAKAIALVWSNFSAIL
jgi:hypothetical protein